MPPRRRANRRRKRLRAATTGLRPTPSPEPFGGADWPRQDRFAGADSPQVLRQGRGVSVAFGRLLLQAFQADGLQVPAHGGVQLPGGDRLLCQDLPEGFQGCGRLEGGSARDQAAVEGAALSEYRSEAGVTSSVPPDACSASAMLNWGCP